MSGIFPCGHPKSGPNVYTQVKKKTGTASESCRICRNVRQHKYVMSKKPKCPECQSTNATPARRNDGIRKCRHCGTRFNARGMRAYGEPVKFKGIPAGRIEIGKGMRWGASGYISGEDRIDSAGGKYRGSQ